MNDHKYIYIRHLCDLVWLFTDLLLRKSPMAQHQRFLSLLSKLITRLILLQRWSLSSLGISLENCWTQWVCAVSVDLNIDICLKTYKITFNDVLCILIVDCGIEEFGPQHSPCKTQVRRCRVWRKAQILHHWRTWEVLRIIHLFMHACMHSLKHV